MNKLSLVILILALWLGACAPRTAPYAGGGTMSQKDIAETFGPILQFMNVRPGVTFADVGAGSGVITVQMSTLMDNASIYIQDIDTSALQSPNLDKIIDYYSTQTKKDLRKHNRYHLVIGEVVHTNLPPASMDLIYTNATIHVLSSPDAMIADIGTRLKPDGLLFVRDSFKGDHGEGDVCSDKTCGRPLLTIEAFLEMMKRNGFQLVKQTPDMSGYPVFGFDFID